MNTAQENKELDYLTLQEKLEEMWEKEEKFLKSIGVDPYNK